ncbi:response regulator transcription factor [Phytohabitans aurantiacus]|jgi:DNA-binding NarL/FixJ family response regulator|uniref:response regulator transcription factor n=1 Tax=Phytohabitans aurantiacus TaxID=3016789 RepID=UPI002493BC84|nr:response regulator transcription factor [Phytohabitans aurantiacus]
MAFSLVAVAEGTLVRAGIAALVGDHDDLLLVGVAGTVAEARPLIDQVRPAAVLLDRHLGGDALAYGAALRHRDPHPGVVLIGGHDDDLLFRALDAGLSAYVPWDAKPATILAAVRHAAAAPSSFTAPDLAAAMARRRQGRVATLSPREREVLLLLRDGLTAPGIATALRVSDSTVKTYLARLYDKLGVHGRGQAVVAAAEQGLFGPRPATG